MSRRFTLLLTIIVAPAVLGACAAAPGTRPHDMSAESHQATAAAEEKQAATHAQLHDPATQKSAETCVREGTERRACWTDAINPTATHEKLAQEHRELAAKHRAAAAALVSAGAAACKGIAEMDRDMSPFAHKADIHLVTELKETIRDEHGIEKQHTAGATVIFGAVPGMTAEWLQRLIDCHLARNAALGHDVPEMAYCPLVPTGVTAKVRTVGNGFAVDIRGDTETTVREIQRRAQGLVSGGKTHPKHETWVQGASTPSKPKLAQIIRASWQR